MDFINISYYIIWNFFYYKILSKVFKRIVNVYTDKEIEYFIGKLAKKFERNESKIQVKINNLKNISDYDIIITDEKESVKNLKKEFKSKDLFEDELVVIGRRRIENISQVANSTIAMPNYKTNIGKKA